MILKKRNKKQIVDLPHKHKIRNKFKLSKCLQRCRHLYYTYACYLPSQLGSVLHSPAEEPTQHQPAQEQSLPWANIIQSENFKICQDVKNWSLVRDALTSVISSPNVYLPAVFFRMSSKAAYMSHLQMSGFSALGFWIVKLQVENLGCESLIIVTRLRGPWFHKISSISDFQG